MYMLQRYIDIFVDQVRLHHRHLGTHRPCAIAALSFPSRLFAQRPAVPHTQFHKLIQIDACTCVHYHLYKTLRRVRPPAMLCSTKLMTLISRQCQIRKHVNPFYGTRLDQQAPTPTHIYKHLDIQVRVYKLIFQDIVTVNRLSSSLHPY